MEVLDKDIIDKKISLEFKQQNSVNDLAVVFKSILSFLKISEKLFEKISKKIKSKK